MNADHVSREIRPRLGTDPMVDVVVIGWNESEATIRSCLQSVKESSGATVHPYFLDNGSNERTFPPDGVHLERSPINLGVAAGRNHGARAGAAPLVCFLDCDARLAPDALRKLAIAVQAHGVGLAAPRFSGQAAAASAGRAPGAWRKVARLLGLTDRYAPMPAATESPSAVREVEFVIGACMMVRREAFEAVGGFDESYFYGPEDVDLCLRLREAGWKIVQVLDAECVHDPRRSWRGLLTRRGWLHARAVIRHLWRHRRWRRRNS